MKFQKNCLLTLFLLLVIACAKPGVSNKIPPNELLITINPSLKYPKEYILVEPIDFPAEALKNTQIKKIK